MIKDIKGVCFSKYMYLLLQIFRKIASNYVMYFLCFLKGILIKRPVTFYGITYFYRSPQSLIKFGSSCTFRSSYRSNLIGINRKCAFSTMRVGAELIVGNNCGFSGTVIGVFTKVVIEDNVRCGANTLITDSDWHTDDIRAGEDKPVVIQKNVWLGEGVKVLKGVTIGENTVVGAGSIVTKSIPANVIAAGNPCRVIRAL